MASSSESSPRADGELRIGAITIPASEIELSATRAQGAGGQNVNKVASKAVLRWPAATSPSLPGDVRARFLQRFHNRITNEGDIVLASQTYRDQERNREECLQRLAEMIRAAAVVPRPRKATKPTKGSQRRRVEGKRHVAKTKAGRRKPAMEE